MKKMTTILSLVLISSTVFGAQLKMENYQCGLEVGKAIANLAKTTAEQDITNLSEDIPDYIAQKNLALTILEKEEKAQIEQAANGSWQSIQYSMGQIKDVSAETYKAINKSCGLDLD